MSCVHFCVSDVSHNDMAEDRCLRNSIMFHVYPILSPGIMEQTPRSAEVLNSDLRQHKHEQSLIKVVTSIAANAYAVRLKVHNLATYYLARTHRHFQLSITSGSVSNPGSRKTQKLNSV